jgi:hypothetical protein
MACVLTTRTDDGPSGTSSGKEVLTTDGRVVGTYGSADGETVGSAGLIEVAESVGGIDNDAGLPAVAEIPGDPENDGGIDNNEGLLVVAEMAGLG